MNAALKPYLPSLGLVLATVLTALAPLLADDRVTGSELLAVILVMATAVATYIVPRVENALWLKPAVASVITGINALQMYLTDGVSASEWVLIAIAVLGALGVVATNKQVPVTPTDAVIRRAG